MSIAEQQSLGDFAKVISGYAFKSKDFIESGVPVVKIANIKHEHVILENAQFLPKDFLTVPDRYHVREGDVMISLTGSHVSQPNSVVGRVARYRHDSVALLNQRAARVVIHDPASLDQAFLYYFLRQKEVTYALALNASGAANQANISPTDVESVKLPLISLATQTRIAAILSAYDDLIQNNRRRIALLEQAVRLLYREWFVHFRFPGHETANFVDGLPEGWERVKLEDVCTRITDGSHASPKSVDEGLPMASVKDMRDWGIETKGCRQIGSDDFDQLVKADCKPLLNDVLIAKDGSYLKHCFVIQKEIDLVILSSIAILRPNDRIDPQYLSFTLRDPHIKERMKGYVSGAALPRIILREFRGFEITLPNEEAQAEWIARIHPIARQCGLLIEQNEQLTKARDLLLPRLMDGRIPV
ncbi:MAG: restriction endonuclease subunit S [Marinosulfonomonas sp.]|nr:restriction endonuclease subunit S [Marinosulfonomonas sp.]